MLPGRDNHFLMEFLWWATSPDFSTDPELPSALPERGGFEMEFEWKLQGRPSEEQSAANTFSRMTGFS